MSMANRTIPFTDRQILSLFVDVPTGIASLRGREVSVYLYYSLTVPFCLIGKHGNEAAPTCIGDGLSEVMVLLHTLNVQVLNANGVVSLDKRMRTLLQVVGTAVRNLFVKYGNFESLVFKPSAVFLLSGKVLLRPCEFSLVFSCVSVILECLSFRSDKQVLQSHVYADSFTRLFKRSSVFFFCKYGNKILSAWCLGNSYLTDFAFYLTMYTTLDTLLELGYEKPASCDRCKLRNGKTILRALGFEVRKLRPLLKEIGIGYFEASDCELQGLRIYFFKPCCCFLLLQ